MNPNVIDIAPTDPLVHQSFMIKVLRVSEPGPVMRIDCPEAACEYWRTVIERQAWYDETREHSVVLLLSARQDVLGFGLVSIGCATESIVNQRDIFRPAVAANAVGIVLMHNHPSGWAEPSVDDVMVTERTKKAASLLHIEFFDDVIVGRPGMAPPQRGRCRGRRAASLKKRDHAISRQGYYSFKWNGGL